MVRKIIKTEEFEDEGYTYIKEIYDDGSKHIKQKVGVNYPEPQKNLHQIDKENYAKLLTDLDRISFIAIKLGLK